MNSVKLIKKRKMGKWFFRQVLEVKSEERYSKEEVLEALRRKGERPEVIKNVEKFLDFCLELGGKIFYRDRYMTDKGYVIRCYTEGKPTSAWISTGRKYNEITLFTRGKKITMKFDKKTTPTSLRIGILEDYDPAEINTYYPYAEIWDGILGPGVSPYIDNIIFRSDGYRVREIVLGRQKF